MVSIMGGDQYVDEFRPEMVSIIDNMRFGCTICGKIMARQAVVRTHIIQMHVAPEYFKCSLCEETIKHRQGFSKHINRKHQMKGGKDYVKMYGTKVSDKSIKLEILNE